MDRHYYEAADEIPEHIGDEDVENVLRQRNRYYHAPPAAASEREQCTRVMADALAKRVLNERDEAIQRAAELEAALERAVAERDQALVSVARLQQAAEDAVQERDQALLSAARLQRATEVAVQERLDVEDDLRFAKEMLHDAAFRNDRLSQQVAALERWREVASHVLDARADGPPTPPPQSESDALGLSRTKEAVTKAVRDAAKLPAAERDKKLKQLKAKWHPDKHEVLKEMAEEISKLINAAVDETLAEAEEPAPEQ